MVIQSAVFSRPAWMYMEDGVIEVNLPEWSGRMDKRYALAELENLKAFIAKVESVLNGPTIRTPRDFTPSERSEVVAEAIAEDEADAAANAAAEAEMWEYVGQVARAVGDKAEAIAVDEALADDDDDESAVDAINRHWEEWIDEDDHFYSWDDEDDWLDWEEWAEAHYTPPPPQCLNHAGRRSYHKDIRRHALMFRETKLYNAYCLMPDVATFEGEVYRIIDPRDLNTNDIPF